MTAVAVPSTQPADDLADVRAARAYLSRVAEVPAPALAAFVAEVGPVLAAGRVRTGDVPDPVAAETSARRDVERVADDFAAAAAFGVRLVVPEDAEWPAWALHPLDQAADGKARAGVPLALWVRGTMALDKAVDRAVSVVGARAATSYGDEIAAEFGHGLAARGLTVVSGAAYGIDGAAHRGALVAGGPTVAVLGCGITVDYPARHSNLLRRIAETGLVISEYPPGVSPGRHRFLVRNRLIACLGAGTVVVEAGLRSGARNTAATASALGRVLMAVPGPVNSCMSDGCHELLRSGQAVAVSSVDEVVESCGRIGTDLVTRDDPPARVTDELGTEALRAYEALGVRTARTADQVAVESGIAVSRIRSLLPQLELTGFARRTEGGWLRDGGAR